MNGLSLSDPEKEALFRALTSKNKGKGVRDVGTAFAVRKLEQFLNEQLQQRTQGRFPLDVQMEAGIDGGNYIGMGRRFEF